jgi:MFS family permease
MIGLAISYERKTTVTEASPTSKPTLIDRVLVNRNFAAMWTGDIISALGDYSFSITLVIWVGLFLAKGQPWAPLAITGLVLSATFPPLLVGPIAGVFVDRWGNKRRVLIIADILQAALVGVLVVTAFLPGGHLPVFWQLGVIYAVNFLLISVDQFFNQAGFALIGQIVPDRDFGRAIGRVIVFVNVGTIVGPAIGAPFFYLFGPSIALLINSLTFVFSLVMLLQVHPPKPAAATVEAAPTEEAAVSATVEAAPASAAPATKPKRTFWREFAAGIQFTFTSRTLRTMLIAMCIETFGTASIPVLNVFFALSNLHINGAYFGALVSSLGVGGLVGSLIGPVILRWIGEARVFWLSLYADGILLIIYSRLTAAIPALVVLFLLGFVAGLFNNAIGPLLLRLTPNSMMGRATAVRVSIISTVNVLGTVLVGFLVSSVLIGLHFTALGMSFGPVDTLFLASGVFAVLSGVYAMFNVFDPLPTSRESATESTPAEAIVSSETIAE